MKLYVNGDSHAAAAEAVNVHSWSQDDSRYFFLGSAPHPENLAVSWSRALADALKMGLNNQSQSGCSNDRIIRVTREYLVDRPCAKDDHLVVISWSTWERQEWLHDEIWWQVGASGMDSVPPDLQERYKRFVIETDWMQNTMGAHEKIWQFHLELQTQGIMHLFFNGDNDFSLVPAIQRKDWSNVYMDPYDPNLTYSNWLKNHGFQTVAPDSWHFGREAHAAWARFMLQYMIQHDLVP